MTPAPADAFDKELEAPERLPDAIDTDTLRKYFTLTQPDLDQVHQCRGAVNKLGFAVQLCTLRWHGYFLPDTRALPSAVIKTIAVQLGVLPLPIDAYPQNAKTRWEHLERIRLHLGFVPCDAGQRDRLLHHLTILAQALPRSTALRHAAYRWLQQEKIVRPGRTTLRDLITAAREAALQTVYAMLTSSLSSGQAEKIESGFWGTTEQETGVSAACWVANVLLSARERRIWRNGHVFVCKSPLQKSKLVRQLLQSQIANPFSCMHLCFNRVFCSVVL